MQHSIPVSNSNLYFPLFVGERSSLLCRDTLYFSSGGHGWTDSRVITIPVFGKISREMEDRRPLFSWALHSSLATHLSPFVHFFLSSRTSPRRLFEKVENRQEYL